MTNALHAPQAGLGSGLPQPEAAPEPAGEQLGSFRFTTLGIVALMLLYFTSVEGLERVLDRHFRAEVARAIHVSPTGGEIVTQIQRGVTTQVQGSPWVRYGGVRVNVTVLGADGLTPLYVGNNVMVPAPPGRELDAAMREAMELLPAIADVFVSVPHGSTLSTGIFVVYSLILLQGVLLYSRRLERLESERLTAAVSSRDRAAERARKIESELAAVRERLNRPDPAETQQAEEIQALERERGELRARLRELGEREQQLRTTASRARELEEERQALEDLLDEALEDVQQKDGAIQQLEDRLKHASRKQAAEGRGRSRGAERLGKRLRTLYKNLEVDERAVSDLAALGDESQRLRAEEGLKRLDDDPETAAIRRKVGGLPPQLSIFELGFAGKGRIYYARSERGGYRILAIGGKASQKQDLEYLSRLSL